MHQDRRPTRHDVQKVLNDLADIRTTLRRSNIRRQPRDALRHDLSRMGLDMHKALEKYHAESALAGRETLRSLWTSTHVSGSLLNYDDASQHSRDKNRETMISSEQERRGMSAGNFGVFPPPSILADYERILPGSAERILSMAEREQACRHRRDQAALNAVSNGIMRSQYAVLGLGIAFSLGAVVAAVNDKILLSLLMALACLVAALFFYIFQSKA